MWGPIGGADNASIKLLKKSPLSSKFKFWIRNIINSLQLKYSHQLKRALSRTDLLLTATSENQTIFKKRFGKPNFYLPENSITTSATLNYSKFNDETKYH